MGTAETLSSRGELFAAGFGFGDIHLVEGEDLTPLSELGRVGRQLGIDDGDVVLRVGRGGIDDVHEQAACARRGAGTPGRGPRLCAPSMRPGISAMK